MHDVCVMEDIKKPTRLESYSIFDDQNFSSWLMLNTFLLDFSYQAVIYDQQVVRKTSKLFYCLFSRAKDRLGAWW